MQQYKQNQLLLLEDIVNIGRKGEVVTVKPGFARNFLLPQKKAVIADKRTLRMQARLQEERAKQAEEDRKESEKIKVAIENQVFSTQVKIDPEGNLYGSVSAADIANLISEKGFTIDKGCVRIGQPIKSLGDHTIPLKLKENVETSIILKVVGDRPIEKKEEEPKPEVEEKKAEEEEQKES